MIDWKIYFHLFSQEKGVKCVISVWNLYFLSKKNLSLYLTQILRYHIFTYFIVSREISIKLDCFYVFCLILFIISIYLCIVIEYFCTSIFSFELRYLSISVHLFFNENFKLSFRTKVFNSEIFLHLYYIYRSPSSLTVCVHYVFHLKNIGRTLNTMNICQLVFDFFSNNN